MLALSAAPAAACMSSGPDGYGSGNVWQNAPDDIPEGAILLQVTGVKHVENTWGFSALVRNGPKSMRGKRYRFYSLGGTSCNSWGDESGFLVTSGQLTTIPNRETDEAMSFLGAQDYAESWWNWISRQFGGASWQYPGEEVGSW